MSTPFYDLASLVVVPSGYKSGKVYAQKPQTTDGQLTFTRASSATRVASNGLIEKVRTNSLLNSQNFSAWTLMGAATRTTGVVDPNGGTTAATISNIPAGNSTDGIRLLSNPVSSSTGNPIRFSIYLKGSGTIGIAVERSLTGDYFIYSAVVTLNSTWTRYEVGGNTGNSTGAGVYIVNATGTTATSVDVAFGQIEIGDVITAYIPTTTAAVSVGPVSGLPRLDYLNSTCPKLLLEPQRTNQALFSEQFSTWISAGGALTSNTSTSPSGYQDADTLTGGRYRSGYAANTNTASCFAKKVDGDNTFTLRVDIPATFFATFNLNSGTIVAVSAGYSATITPYGNGWYRCTLTTPAATPISNFVLYSASAGVSSTLIWGAQLEAGAYATSYIPTLAASVTRVADAALKTGISSLIGQTEGVLYSDFNYSGNAQGGIQIYPFYIGQGTFVNSITIGIFQDQLLCRVFLSGTAQNYFTSSNLLVGRNKVAFLYATNNLKLFLNGVLIATDTSATIPACDQIYFGSSGTSVATELINVNTNLLFKNILTDAQCIELTAL